jgi:hypothetical protein
MEFRFPLRKFATTILMVLIVIGFTLAAPAIRAGTDSETGKNATELDTGYGGFPTVHPSGADPDTCSSSTGIEDGDPDDIEASGSDWWGWLAALLKVLEI